MPCNSSLSAILVALALCGASAQSSISFGRQPTREIYGRQRLQKLGIPKVAIMFITKGDMPHERSWASWLSAAKWLVPPAYANVEFSSSESMLPKQTWRQSSEQKTGMQHYKEQALFNMYVHAPPNHTGYAPETVFRDRDINDRVQVVWGEFPMVVAMRLLLRAALSDLLNQRFMYACEQTIPLYPATLVYQQLMGESKSRINACPDRQRTNDDENAYGLDRWSADMLPHITLEMWSKSSQWLLLSRKLATIVDDDELVVQLFAKHCLPGRRCVGDEHYFPTVLSYNGLGNQTSCRGNLISTTWTGDDHPLAYTDKDVKPALILSLRESAADQGSGPRCHSQSALRSAEQSFVRTTPQWEFSQRAVEEAKQFDVSLLSDEPCTLFARKFGSETAASVEAVFRGCDAQIGIAPEPQCFDLGRVRTRTRFSARFVRKGSGIY